MAKFTRYDPRNKKNGKHKELHQIKDLKIRDVEHSKKTFRKESVVEKESHD